MYRACSAAAAAWGLCQAGKGEVMHGCVMMGAVHHARAPACVGSDVGLGNPADRVTRSENNVEVAVPPELGHQRRGLGGRERGHHPRQLEVDLATVRQARPKRDPSATQA